MSDNLRNYTKALYGFDATVRRTASSAWSAPSPCPGWTAADVVAHNVGMCDMIAGFTRGVSAKGPRQDRLDDPAAAWQSSLDGLLAALDTAGALQAVAKTPWGELPVDKFLGFAWVDPVVHTWDLAQAVGEPTVLDADQVRRGITQLERAGASLVGPGRFEPAVEVSSDADAVDRLVALSGRNPR
ncbi:MAG: TIGR03086 family metal-binding protein [Acidimicrobiia bacterium]|nr:TIGR03086 family metal-binding protein [Acidimicrobiia bacterium]